MDKVVHDGKEYKKLAVLADEFNYTTDYIGQLCRAGKVDARLVGRAWYVHPESLRDHKRNRYQETFEKKIDNEVAAEASKHYEKRVDVDVLRTKKTTKIHRDLEGDYREVAIRYETDDDSLLPRIDKPQSTEVPVEVAGGTQIKIQSTAKKGRPTTLKPTELPKVYLKGKVPVASIHERADLPVKEIKQAHVPARIQSVPTQKLEESRPQTSVKKVQNMPIKHSHIDSRERLRKRVNNHRRKDGNATPKVLVPDPNTQHRPNKTPETRNRKSASKKTPPKTKKNGFLNILLLIAAVLLALAFLTLELELVSLGGETSQRIIWNEFTL